MKKRNEKHLLTYLYFLLKRVGVCKGQVWHSLMIYLSVYCYHGHTNAGYHIHIALVSQDMVYILKICIAWQLLLFFYEQNMASRVASKAVEQEQNFNSEINTVQLPRQIDDTCSCRYKKQGAKTQNVCSARWRKVGTEKRLDYRHIQKQKYWHKMYKLLLI